MSLSLVPTGSLRGWGAPIAAWDFASAVAQVDFTGLGAYREILLLGFDLAHDSGASTLPLARLSTDNGATFISAAASYETYGRASTATSLDLGTAGGAAAVKFALRAHFADFNDAARQTKMHSTAPQLGVTTGNGVVLGRRLANEANNALRVLFGSGNIVSGMLRLYGR